MSRADEVLVEAGYTAKTDKLNEAELPKITKIVSRLESIKKDLNNPGLTKSVGKIIGTNQTYLKEIAASVSDALDSAEDLLIDIKNE